LQHFIGEIYMSYTSAKSAGGSPKNNGGTIVNAGNVAAGTPVTKVIGVNEINGSTSQYGTKVVVNTAVGNGTTDPHGTIKVKSAGTFAYRPAQGEGFLLRAAGDTASKINGTASTLLSIPGGVSNKSIHKLTSTSALGAYASTSYDVLARPSTSVVPGRTKGLGAGDPVNYVQVDDGVTTSNVDNAASPTRSVPGELTYMFGGKAPKNDTYKARNSNES
jgi:hypothetical protein